MEAGGEHHGAARLPDAERAARVGAEEEVLDRDGLGLVLGDQVAYARVDPGEPALERLAAVGGDDAAVERRQPLPACEHDAVAGVGGAWGDSEDDHGPGGGFSGGGGGPP